jgi:hypothetical protein
MRLIYELCARGIHFFGAIQDWAWDRMHRDDPPGPDVEFMSMVEQAILDEVRPRNTMRSFLRRGE